MPATFWNLRLWTPSPMRFPHPPEHPHIGAIYDLARFGEWRFLVLELVDGETLNQRISRGVIPVGEAMVIAKQLQKLSKPHMKKA